ncbi:MAG: DUF58 domain-containing protein [Planctomycetes bacterium]|nr:DUF58 domain-containing protein [Planctomycetota bacterium]
MSPTRRALAGACAWAALGLAACFVPLLVAAWAWAGGVFLALALVDALRVLRRAPLQVQRSHAHSLALGAWTTVRVRLLNPSGASERVELFDGYPERTECEGLPRTCVVPAGQGLELTYRMRAVRRGEGLFRPCEVLRGSPWRLWVKRELARVPGSVRIYPNFASIAGFTLHALENRIQLMGIRRRQRRGEGLEFRQLRDYQQGDMLRQIDWKATSRRGKPISREYQEERDQQVLFLLDCGRRMRALDGETAHFDHCLNALLLVAYVALRQGDSVSLLTFGGVDRRLPPVKGKQSMSTLLNAVYDLETTLEPPDFVEAAARLKAFQQRRSLVIVLTNQRDEDEADLRPALELLRRRHLVVLASLREVQVERLLEKGIQGHADALEVCAALDYVRARRTSLERLSGRGVITMDIPPAELAVALAEKYLEIKRAGRL